MTNLDAIIEKAKKENVPGNYQCDIIMVTPEIAELFLQLNTKNRSEKKHTVDLYTREMDEDRWGFNGESIQFNTKGELINGQHRLKALIKSGKSYPMTIIRNVPDDSYKTIDQQHTRNLQDMLEMEGVKCATLKAAILTKYLLWSRKDGTTDIKTSLRKCNISKDKALQEYKENSKFYDEIHDKALHCYQKLDLLSPSEYGGFICLLIKQKKHEKQKVFDFFDKFIGSGNSVPVITILRDSLHKLKYKNIRLTPTEKYAYVAITWNAYISGKTFKKITFDKKIDETPTFM